MANPFYTPTGTPASGSGGLSALVRAEFAAIAEAFDLLPAFTGLAGQAVVVNSGGTALVTTTGALALAGNFTTTGAFNTSLTQSASVTLALPGVSGTLATLAGAETLSNKTLVAPALGTPASGVLTNCTGTAAALAVGSAQNVTSGGTVVTGSVSTNTVSANSATITTITASGAITAGSVTSSGNVTGAQIGTPTGDPSIFGRAGTIYFGSEIAAPSSSGAYFQLYVDVVDNKLKAISAANTITVLANF